MTVIVLEGLEFYAHHGYYPEEQKLGNRFQVDLKIKIKVEIDSDREDLNQTIDYVRVYELVSQQMKTKFKLLETLGQSIIHQIRSHFSGVLGVEVTISKFNPPISGLCKRVAVTRIWNQEK